MSENSGGYVLVLSDGRTAWSGVRVRWSRYDGARWLARARRLAGHGRWIAPPLKLISSHYVEDPVQLRAELAERLGKRFAARGRAGAARVRRALDRALAEDKSRLEARFDPLTGLFRVPGDALSPPAKRVVTGLAREILSATPEIRRTLPLQLRRPYGLGLLWPLLGVRLDAEKIPAVYRPEVYRALVRALAGNHLTDAEMLTVLKSVDEQNAEYRLGIWDYGRSIPRRQERDAPGAERFAAWLREPRGHILRTIGEYRRRIHGSLAVRLGIWTFRLLQLAIFAAVMTAAAWLILRIESGLMPGLTLLFAAGAAIPAGRLYRRPDMAKLMGYIGEGELEELDGEIESLHPLTLEPARPHAATPPSAPFMPVPHGAETAPGQAVDIPAPFPVPPVTVPVPDVTPKNTTPPKASPVPEASPVPRATPVPRPGSAAESGPAVVKPKSLPVPDAITAAQLAQAYLAMPSEPFPFPVPRLEAEGEARVESKTGRSEPAADHPVTEPTDANAPLPAGNLASKPVTSDSAAPRTVVTAADLAKAALFRPAGPVPFTESGRKSPDGSGGGKMVPPPPIYRSTPAKPVPEAGTSDPANAAPTRSNSPVAFPSPHGLGADEPKSGSDPHGAQAEPALSEADAEEIYDAAGIFTLGWNMPIPVPNWMAATLPDLAPELPPEPKAPATVPSPGTDGLSANAPATGKSRTCHATPLPPAMPSPAFWGIDISGLHDDLPEPGAGKGRDR